MHKVESLVGNVMVANAKVLSQETLQVEVAAIQIVEMFLNVQRGKFVKIAKRVKTAEETAAGATRVKTFVVNQLAVAEAAAKVNAATLRDFV